MPKMEAVIAVRYRVPLDTDVPDPEFVPAQTKYRDGTAIPEDKLPMEMKNEAPVQKARRQAAKDAEKVAKEWSKKPLVGSGEVVDAMVEEVVET